MGVSVSGLVGVCHTFSISLLAGQLMVSRYDDVSRRNLEKAHVSTKIRFIESSYMCDHN